MILHNYLVKLHSRNALFVHFWSNIYVQVVLNENWPRDITMTALSIAASQVLRSSGPTQRGTIGAVLTAGSAVYSTSRPASGRPASVTAR